VESSCSVRCESFIVVVMNLMDERVLCIISSVIWVLFTIPTIVYCGYQLHVNWREQYMIKRRRAIIITIYCIFSAMLLFNIPLIVIPNLLGLNTTNSIWHQIFEALDIPGRWAINLLFGSRVWLLYFDYHHGTSLASKSWQILISPDSVEQNWFLQNRRTLGNHDFILKWIIGPIVFLRIIVHIALIYLVPSASFLYVEPILFGVNTVIVLLFMGWIWSKYPKFEDTFFIRHELRIVFLTVAIGSTCLGILLVILRHFNISPAMQACVGQLFAGFMLLMMIVYPKRMMIHELEEMVQYQSGGRGQIDLADHWENKMGTKHGYQQFANYLTKQFAVESLLFVTEFVQLRRAMLQCEAMSEHIGTESRLTYVLHLAPDLPLSAMTEQLIDKLKHAEDSNLPAIVYDSMEELYHKYIEIGTKLEVNISFRERKKIDDIFVKDPSNSSHQTASEAPTGPDASTIVVSTNDTTSRPIDLSYILSIFEIAVEECVSLMKQSAIRYSVDQEAPKAILERTRSRSAATKDTTKDEQSSECSCDSQTVGDSSPCTSTVGTVGTSASNGY